MRIELQPAYVLHRRPYRESSVLLEIFSRDFGRVGLVARGVRRQSSRLRSVLEPFRPLLLSWSARSELGTLTAADPERAGHTLPGSALASAFYLNELLLRLLARSDPHPELFETYRAALARLAGPEGPESVLRVFEKRLLEAIGYGLVLDRDIESGAPIEASATYCYRLEAGPTASPDVAQEIAEQEIAEQMGVYVRGDTLIALARERFDATQQLREAKRLMRTVLGPYLGERPLGSRSLLETPARKRAPARRD